MSKVKTEQQISEIRKMAKEISNLLEYSLSLIVLGRSTLEVDRQIELKMKQMGVTGSCKGYEGYPTVSCLSVNDQVTHGVPDSRILQEGDIVDIDLVIERNGYFSDMSRTVAVGNISTAAEKLIKTTEVCLLRAIQQVKPGNTLGDIGYAIESHANRNGYSVADGYTGHFIGLSMHESPMVTNTGKKGKGLKLKPGMIFCIEPMINEGRSEVNTVGWDARTADGKLSSRCEHMVLVTKNGHEVLTSFPK